MTFTESVLELLQLLLRFSDLLLDLLLPQLLLELDLLELGCVEVVGVELSREGESK